MPAACFIGVSLVGCDRQAAVALMTLGTMFIAGMYCGFLTNHVDIAPNYAGTLMALTNTAATIPGFIVPAFVGQLTHGNVSNFLGCVFNFSSCLKYLYLNFSKLWVSGKLFFSPRRLFSVLSSSSTQCWDLEKSNRGTTSLITKLT